MPCCLSKSEASKVHSVFAHQHDAPFSWAQGRRRSLFGDLPDMSCTWASQIEGEALHRHPVVIPSSLIRLDRSYQQESEKRMQAQALGEILWLNLPGKNLLLLWINVNIRCRSEVTYICSNCGKIIPFAQVERNHITFLAYIKILLRVPLDRNEIAENRWGESDKKIPVKNHQRTSPSHFHQSQLVSSRKPGRFELWLLEQKMPVAMFAFFLPLAVVLLVTRLRRLTSGKLLMFFFAKVSGLIFVEKWTPQRVAPEIKNPAL